MRVLLADDHELVLDCFRAFIAKLEPTCELVTANNFCDAFRIAREQGPFSVIVLDLNMPGMHGLDGLHSAIGAFPETSVAIITGMITRSAASSVLGAGAKGFIPKTLGGEDLIEALRDLAAGEIYVPQDLLIGHSRGNSTPDFGMESLSTREREVATMLMGGSYNKEIARGLNVQEVTVKLHVRNLCRKLNAKNRTQLAVRLLELYHNTAPVDS